MSLTVKAAPMEHFPWLMQRASWAPALNAKAIEAVDGLGRIQGMVAFDKWTLNAAQVHVAAETRGAVKALLVPAFAWAFEQAHLGVMLATIASRNRRALSLAWRLGFHLKGRTWHGLSEREGLVHLEMRKELCPWLSGTHPGKRWPIGPAADDTRWEDFHGAPPSHRPPVMPRHFIPVPTAPYDDEAWRTTLDEEMTHGS